MGRVERLLVLVLSLGGLGILLVTANYGGRLIFEHAAAIPSKVLQAELRERTGTHEHGGMGVHDHGGNRVHPLEVDSAAPPAGHVDPPGTPPHTHAPGTAPHQD